MKSLLLIAIQLYWRIGRQRHRRLCIFRESCSHHVYHVASQEGFVIGMRALVRRFQICRPGYTIIPTHLGIGVRLVDGTSITEDEASLSVLEPYRRAADQIELRVKCHEQTPL